MSEEDVSKESGYEYGDSSYVPSSSCVINMPQRTNDGVEVITKYSFEVDSKGKIKPTFTGEIHRSFPSSTMLFAGKEYPQEMIKQDAEFLVKFAQEILNQTPKIKEEEKSE